MNNLPLRVESTLQNVKTKVLGGCKNVDRESYDPSHVLGCIKGGKSVITLDSNRDLGEDFMNEDLNDIFLLTASTSRANNDDDAAFSDAAVSDAAFSDAAISDAAFSDAAFSEGLTGTGGTSDEVRLATEAILFVSKLHNYITDFFHHTDY